MPTLPKHLALYAHPERYCVAAGSKLGIEAGIEYRNPKAASLPPRKAPAKVAVVAWELRDARTDAIVTSRRLGFLVFGRRRVVDPSPCENFDGSGCRFPTRIEVDIPQGIKGTHYVVLLGEDESLRSERAYFTVRDEAHRASILVVHPTYTWQAYNAMGGQSFYFPTGYSMQELRTASLQRPIAAATPRHHVPQASVNFEQVLLEAGMEFDTCDSEHVHQHADVLQGYRTILLTSHDEYITYEMRQAFDRFLEAGGRFAVFSGNTGWYKVRREGAQIEIVYGPHDQTPDVTQRTGQWDFENVGDPIERTLGMSYTFGGFPIGRRHDEAEMVAYGMTEQEIENVNGMRCLAAEHPIFAGTGLAKDEFFGAANNLVHVEIDSLPMTMEGEVDYGRAPHAPRGVRVLGECFVSSYLGHAIERVPAMIEFRRGKGHVVHAGSIGWCVALPKEPVCQRILLNTLRYLEELPSTAGATGDGEAIVPVGGEKPIVKVEHPIIIHGMSRSGTTLLNVMLDAHPAVAMSYDVTPNRMEMDLAAAISLAADVLDQHGYTSLTDPADAESFDALCNALQSRAGTDGHALSRLFVVCRRSLVSPNETLAALRQAHASGVEDLADDFARLKIGAFIVEAKRARLGRDHAGAKIIYPPEKVIEIYPGARYLLIIRDPRDVYASHVRVGWEAEPEKIARGWRVRVERLHQLEADPRFEVLHVPFEQLIAEPATWSDRMCDFLGIPLVDIARQFDQAGTFEVDRAFDGNEHIFWQRRGLDEGRIGHWEKLISQDEGKRIIAVCGEQMAELGYL